MCAERLHGKRITSSTFCFAKRWSQKATTPGRCPGRANQAAARLTQARSTGYRAGRVRADRGHPRTRVLKGRRADFQRRRFLLAFCGAWDHRDAHVHSGFVVATSLQGPTPRAPTASSEHASRASTSEPRRFRENMTPQHAGSAGRGNTMTDSWSAQPSSLAWRLGSGGS